MFKSADNANIWLPSISLSLTNPAGLFPHESDSVQEQVGGSSGLGAATYAAAGRG